MGGRKHKHLLVAPVARLSLVHLATLHPAGLVALPVHYFQRRRTPRLPETANNSSGLPYAYDSTARLVGWIVQCL